MHAPQQEPYLLLQVSEPNAGLTLLPLLTSQSATVMTAHAAQIVSQATTELRRRRVIISSSSRIFGHRRSPTLLHTRLAWRHLSSWSQTGLQTHQPTGYQPTATYYDILEREANERYLWGPLRHARYLRVQSISPPMCISSGLIFTIRIPTLPARLSSRKLILQSRRPTR